MIYIHKYKSDQRQRAETYYHWSKKLFSFLLLYTMQERENVSETAMNYITPLEKAK